MTTSTYIVRVSRRERRGPWWQWYRRARGLELEIDGRGTTRTVGTRDLDTARALALDYLHALGEPVTADVTICWVDVGQ